MRNEYQANRELARARNIGYKPRPVYVKDSPPLWKNVGFLVYMAVSIIPAIGILWSSF